MRSETAGKRPRRDHRHSGSRHIRVATVTATGTMTFVAGTGAGVKTKTGIMTKTGIVTEAGSGTITSIGTKTACGTAAFGPIGPCRLPDPGSGIGTGSGSIVTETGTFTGPETQPGRGTQITSETVTSSGSSVGNGRHDAGMPDTPGAQPDVPLGSLSCNMLASQYDNSCKVDSDCVAVPLGDPCMVSCASICLAAALNIRVAYQYTADFAVLNAGRNEGVFCGCGCSTEPCCRQGICSNSCAVCQ